MVAAVDEHSDRKNEGVALNLALGIDRDEIIGAIQELVDRLTANPRVLGIVWQELATEARGAIHISCLHEKLEHYFGGKYHGVDGYLLRQRDFWHVFESAPDFDRRRFATWANQQHLGAAHLCDRVAVEHLVRHHALVRPLPRARHLRARGAARRVAAHRTSAKVVVRDVDTRVEVVEGRLLASGEAKRVDVIQVGR